MELFLLDRRFSTFFAFLLSAFLLSAFFAMSESTSMAASRVSSLVSGKHRSQRHTLILRGRWLVLVLVSSCSTSVRHSQQS